MILGWVRKVKPWKTGIRYSICAVKPTDSDISIYGYIPVVPKSDLDIVVAENEALKLEIHMLRTKIYG